ncbi:hypothetical protein M8494_16225 [Serratia ureilytica]
MDELKSQLADYQQALDVQQTRAIQYQQALQALERARALCQLPDLTADNAEQWLIPSSPRAGGDRSAADAGTEAERGRRRARPVRTGLSVGG